MLIGRSGARLRHDTRARVLKVLTSEPLTLSQIAVRARIPGRGRQREAFLVLTRLEAEGEAIKETLRQVPRWRAPPPDLSGLRSSSDCEA